MTFYYLLMCGEFMNTPICRDHWTSHRIVAFDSERAWESQTEDKEAYRAYLVDSSNGLCDSLVDWNWDRGRMWKKMDADDLYSS